MYPNSINLVFHIIDFNKQKGINLDKNSHKITKIFMLVVILLLIAFITQGCGEVKYEITTELDPKDIGYKALSDDDYIENIEKAPATIQKYRATRLIRSSDTSAWFMDENGKVQFITADRVEIKILE